MDNAEKLCDVEKINIDAFKNNVFSFGSRGQEYEDEKYKKKVIEDEDKEFEDKVKKNYTPEERSKDVLSEFNKLILKEENSINNELFKKHFKYQSTTDMLKKCVQHRRHREK